MRQGSDRVRFMLFVMLVKFPKAQFSDAIRTDYTGFSDLSRASIQMVHDRVGLTVSIDEARRLEDETTIRLKRAQKLSLIVDLDQTIIQATVDPTVGEWMEQTDNPNHRALADVQKFRLSIDGDRMPQEGEEGCWYYVKMR